MRFTSNMKTVWTNRRGVQAKAFPLFALLMICAIMGSLLGPQHISAAAKDDPGKFTAGQAQPGAIHNAGAVKPNAATAAQPGDFDTTFGNGGGLTINYGSAPDEAYGSALQPDGKIVIVGEALTDNNSGRTSFALARLTKTGQLDTTFGSGGKVISNFVSTGSAGARAVKILANGQILVAGYSYNSSYFHTTFALARYNANGALDTTFGTNGVAYAPVEKGTGGNGPQDMATDMAIDGAGNIVLVGYTGFIIMNFAAARFTPDGKLDTTFSDHGAWNKTISGDSRGAVVAIQPDGKILIGGSAYRNNAPDFALVRLLPNGSFDATFGAQGIALTEFDGGSDYVSGIALLPNGKILLSGTAQVPAPNGVTRYGTALAQYNSNGTLDTTWGSGNSGKQLWTWGSELGTAWGASLVRLADGRLLTTGSYLNDYMTVTIYKADGTPDPAFAQGGGQTLINFSSGFDRGDTVLAQPDGNIVVAGQAVPDGNNKLQTDFAIVRVIGLGATGAPSATATALATNTATRTATATATRTAAPANTATRTSTATATRTGVATGTATRTASATATRTAVATNTATKTATATNTPVKSTTPTNTATATATPGAITCPAMTWSNLQGVSASGDAITKTLASNNWNAGATSQLAMQSGDGYALMSVNSTTNYLIFGLGYGDASASYTDVEFGFYLSGIGQQMQVWESGLYRATLPGIYQIGDTLKVAVEKGKVNYYRNGTLLYTSALTPTYPLKFDSSIYSQGAQITKARLCGTKVAPIANTTATATTVSNFK